MRIGKEFQLTGSSYNLWKALRKGCGRVWNQSGCFYSHQEYSKRHCFDCSVWDIFLAFWSWDGEYWGPWRFWMRFLTRVSLLLVLGYFPDLQPGCQLVPSSPLPGLCRDYLSCPSLLLWVLTSSIICIYTHRSMFTSLVSQWLKFWNVWWSNGELLSSSEAGKQGVCETSNVYTEEQSQQVLKTGW